MRVLTWLLLRGRTVELAAAERHLRGELALRARCALLGHPSPHQPPAGLLAGALVLILLLIAAHVRTH